MERWSGSSSSEDQTARNAGAVAGIDAPTAAASTTSTAAGTFALSATTIERNTSAHAAVTGTMTRVPSRSIARPCASPESENPAVSAATAAPAGAKEPVVWRSVSNSTRPSAVWPG